MSSTKLLAGLVAVAALGFGGYWLMQSMSTPESEYAGGPDNSQASLNESGDESNSSDSTSASGASTNTSADTGVQQSSSINSDLSALDSLYEEDYDDSDLDATFSAEGANSLTESYDY